MHVQYYLQLSFSTGQMFGMNNYNAPYKNDLSQLVVFRRAFPTDLFFLASLRILVISHQCFISALSPLINLTLTTQRSRDLQKRTNVESSWSYSSNDMLGDESMVDRLKTT